jgi:hypothetical protein
MTLTKEDFLKQISDVDLSERLLKKLYNLAIQAQKEQTPIVKKTIPKDERYMVFLKFVNKILVNIGKEEITDLYDFKNINRLLIIKKENLETLEQMKDELFKHFNKDKSGYYYNSESKVLNIMRRICKQLSLTLQKKQMSKIVNRKVETHYLYTIV